MGLDDDSTASVRIEYGDLQSGRGLAPIEPTGSNNGASGKRAIVVVAVALLAVAGVVYALAPNSGTTALGTPITTTTVAPSTSEAPSTTDSASDEEAESQDSSVDPTEAAVDPLDSFASADSLFLAFNVVPAEVGWFAHGFSNNEQEGGLYRSPDGLNWNQLPLDDLPGGSVVGFERLSGGFVLALDESNTWNEQGSPGDEAFRISFWVSPDAATWTLDPTRPTLDGVGFPYPVKMSDVATAVPVIGPATETSKASLIEYLTPTLSADVAKEICSAVRRTTDEGDVIAFADCDAQIVVELGEGEAPELFALENPGVEECVSLLGGLGAQSSVLQIVGTDGSSETVDLGNRFALFGELFENTFLGAPSEVAAQIDPGCLADPVGEVSDGGVVVRWNPEVGTDLVPLPEPITGSFLLGVAGAPDGRAFVAGMSSVMAASAPFDDWQSLVIGRSNGEENPEFEGGISVATDGSIFLGIDGATWFLARPDDTEWIEVEVGPRNFGTVLLAGDDFAIVEVGAFDGPNSTLVKVPLS